MIHTNEMRDICNYINKLYRYYWLDECVCGWCVKNKTK